jgi:hypothetical protein
MNSLQDFNSHGPLLNVRKDMQARHLERSSHPSHSNDSIPVERIQFRIQGLMFDKRMQTNFCHPEKLVLLKRNSSILEQPVSSDILTRELAILKSFPKGTETINLLWKAMMNFSIIEPALAKRQDSGAFLNESRSCSLFDRSTERPHKLCLPPPLLCSHDDPQDEDDDSEDHSSDHSSLNISADDSAVTKEAPEVHRSSNCAFLQTRPQSPFVKAANGPTLFFEFEEDDAPSGLSSLPTNFDFRIADLAQKRQRSSAVTPHKKASSPSSSLSGKSVSFSESVAVYSHDDWSVRLAAHREEKKRVKEARRKPLFRMRFPIGVRGGLSKSKLKTKKFSTTYWWSGIKGLCARFLPACVPRKKSACFTVEDEESQLDPAGHFFRTL